MNKILSKKAYTELAEKTVAELKIGGESVKEAYDKAIFVEAYALAMRIRQQAENDRRDALSLARVITDGLALEDSFAISQETAKYLQDIKVLDVLLNQAFIHESK